MRFKQIFGSWRIYALSALKLAAVPLLAYAVLRHVLTNEFALCVLTVLLCMPIATNTTILSYQYGADRKTQIPARFEPVFCASTENIS